MERSSENDNQNHCKGMRKYGGRAELEELLDLLLARRVGEQVLEGSRGKANIRIAGNAANLVERLQTRDT